MKDTRDLRDPQELGQWFKDQRTADESKPLSSWAPIIESQCDRGIVKIPNVSSHESMGTEQVARYQEELKERAEQGDRYAKSLLEGQTWDEPED